MKKSLQAQLVGTVLLAELLLAGGLLAVGRRAVFQQLRSGSNAALSGRALSVAALVRYPEDQSTKLLFDKGLVPQPLDSRFADAWEVFGPDGALIARSPWWPQELGSGLQLRPGFWVVHAGGHELRGIRLNRLPILDEETGTPVSPASLTVLYATPTEPMEERLAATMFTIGASALLLLLATGIFAAWLVRRSLSPLRHLALEAEKISARQWTFAAPAEATRLDELRPLVESLQVMLRGLRQAFESQRDFVAAAAHELKTPVAIQKSSLQLLLHRDLPAEEYKRGLQQALRDVERTEELLQRLLRLARAEQAASGAAPRETQAVALSESCETALARMRPYAESRGVRLQFVPDGPARVKADPDDLLVVWSNLLENAIRYSGRDQQVTLSVEAGRPRPAWASVVVADQGCGIEAAQQMRIFERFYRGDQSRARDTGGFGLGLAIVKTLVEAYGGSVGVESEPGRGSRFEVKLPLA